MQIKRKLLDMLRDKIRFKHYSIKTEKSYVGWIKDYIFYHNKKHPIDLARPKANEKTSGFLPMEREWQDKLLSCGFIDTFRHVHGDVEDRYSWWSYRAGARGNNVGWRIDYFYVSDDLTDKIVDADILDQVMGSDHCPVKLVLEV